MWRKDCSSLSLGSLSKAFERSKDLHTSSDQGSGAGSMHGCCRESATCCLMRLQWALTLSKALLGAGLSDGGFAGWLVVFGV